MFSCDLESPQASDEPCKCQKGYRGHANSKPQCLVVQVTRCTRASNTLPLAEVLVGQAAVHAKSELVVNTQVSGFRGSRDGRVCVVDDQRVFLRQQRLSHSGLGVGVGIPDKSGRGFIRHVLCQSPGRGDGTAGHQHVDGGGRGLQRGVVPCPSDGLANTIQSSAGGSHGRDHGNATSGVFGIERRVCCSTRPVIGTGARCRSICACACRFCLAASVQVCRRHFCGGFGCRRSRLLGRVCGGRGGASFLGCRVWSVMMQLVK